MSPASTRLSTARRGGPSGTRPRHDTTFLTNRSTTMNLMYEELARAQMSARLGEAHSRRRGHALVLSRRLSRRAERASREARLALARAR